ncbi:MAG: metal ABC transporter permease, partial [Acidimicrobiia bacterium]
VGTAQRLASSFRSTLIWSAGVGAASAVTGLAAARIFGLAPGGSIVLVAAAAFIVATVLGARLRPGRVVGTPLSA